MKKTLIWCCAASLFASTGGYGLDLTPHFVTRIDGTRSEDIPFFIEGEKRYSMELPRRVTASHTEGEAVFYFRALDDATLTLKPSPFKPEALFDGPSLEAYRKAALGMVPQGATFVSIQGEAPNPFPFNGWTSHRFVVAYQLPGRSFLQDVTFLNFSAKQQILLLTNAPANQFEQAKALTSELMGAWRTLRPGESIAVPPPL